MGLLGTKQPNPPTPLAPKYPRLPGAPGGPLAPAPTTRATAPTGPTVIVPDANTKYFGDPSLNPPAPAVPQEKAPDVFNPVAQTDTAAGTYAAAPAAAAPAPEVTAAPIGAPYDPSVDPFASMGGGVQLPGGGWVPKGHPLDPAMQAAGGGTSTATGGGTTTGGTTTTDTTTTDTTGGGGTVNSSYTASAGVPTDPQLDAARKQALMDLLNQPEITGQSIHDSPAAQAYRLGQARQNTAAMAQAAESAAQGGTLGSGGFDTQVQGLAQQGAEAQAQFEGGLATTQQQARMQSLQFGIQQAQQSGQFEAAQSLQKELADLQAQVQREQLAAQTASQQASLELQRQQLAQQAAQASGELGYNYAQLAQSGLQANNQLGYNYTSLQAELNRQALEAALGGVGGYGGAVTG